MTFSISGDIVAGKAAREGPESAAKSPGATLHPVFVVIIRVSPATVEANFILFK